MSDKPKIAIVGLGVIGTSLGLALRQAQDDYLIIGHDKDQGQARAASKAGAVHKTEWNLISTVEDADAIVLALPLDAIRDTMAAIAEDLKQGVVITDTANVKAPVMEWARELLPAHVSFIGGDPILPSGQGGSEASADLFRGGIYCLTPSATAQPVAMDFVTSLAELVGAQPFFLDAAEHDGLVAGAEHLPAIVAMALLRSTQGARAWKEMRKVAGTGYEQVSFLGSSDAALYKSALLANSANILRWIDEFTASLEQLRDMIEQENEAGLSEAVEALLRARDEWLRERSVKLWDQAEQHMTDRIERPSFFRQAFLGGGLPKDRGKEEKGRKP